MRTNASSPRVFFDARYIDPVFHNGISRYSAELGTALAAQIPITFLICDEAQKKALPKDAEFLMIHAPTSAKEPLTARILNKYAPDVVYSPMQTMGSVGRKYKLILTLHDMIYYRHRTPPHQFNHAVRLGWRLYHATYAPQRVALNGADVVATVSKTSKHDIEAAKLTKRPVIVVSNAPQDLAQYLKKEKRKSAEATQTPTNLVYMGAFIGYKNVETLIKGMCHLPGYTLHLLSRIQPARKKQLENLVPHGAQVVFHNGVSDAEYAQLLHDNALLVTASLDEGYGLPIAEAGGIGVPSVVSDLPIFHEVAGNAALYFDPASPVDFARAVRAASKPSTYASLSNKAFTQAHSFSWDESAKVLAAAIESLIK